ADVDGFEMVLGRMQPPVQRHEHREEDHDSAHQYAVVDELVPVPLHRAEADAHRWSPVMRFTAAAVRAASARAKSRARAPVSGSARAADAWFGARVSCWPHACLAGLRDFSQRTST